MFRNFIAGTSLVVLCLSRVSFGATLDFDLAKKEEAARVERAIPVIAAALAAWNPTVVESEMTRELRESYREYGLQRGVVLPALMLIDMSFVVDKPGFASLIAPVLNELSPESAGVVEKKTGLPTQFAPALIDEKGRIRLPSAREKMQKALGDAFAPREKRSGGGLGEALGGDDSVIGRRRLGNVKPLSQDDFDEKPRAVRKGPMSNMDQVSYGACAKRCVNDVRDGAQGWGAVGAIVGGSVGAMGAGAGAVPGAGAGGLIGAGLGAAEGVARCSTSFECKRGIEKDEKQEAPKTENPAPAPAEQPKTEEPKKEEPKKEEPKKEEPKKAEPKKAEPKKEEPKKDEKKDGDKKKCDGKDCPKDKESSRPRWMDEREDEREAEEQKENRDRKRTIFEKNRDRINPGRNPHPENENVNSERKKPGRAADIHVIDTSSKMPEFNPKADLIPKGAIDPRVVTPGRRP